jgi:predicted dehydrogenase
MTDVGRVAIVGTGSRARLYTRGLAGRAGYAVAALCDPSPTRMAYHNRLLASAGRGAASVWSPDGFAEMLAEEDITEVVVATVDELHDQYLIPAVEAGCRVVTEKPMTVDASKCQAILDATSRTGNPLTVAFNYRYNPVHEQVWRLLHEQAIGEVLSVHFEWLLDVRHGADYFRRWHREKAHSGRESQAASTCCSVPLARPSGGVPGAAWTSPPDRSHSQVSRAPHDGFRRKSRLLMAGFTTVSSDSLTADRDDYCRG